MSEKTDIQWADYPEIAHFVAAVQALCAEAIREIAGSAKSSGTIEPGVRISIGFRTISAVMRLYDALPEDLRVGPCLPCLPAGRPTGRR